MFSNLLYKDIAKKILIIIGVAAVVFLVLKGIDAAENFTPGAEDKAALQPDFMDIYAVLPDGQRLCMYKKENQVYFFLPSYASKAVLEFDGTHKIMLSGVSQLSGTDILPGEYEAEIDGSKYVLHCLKSENMPAVYIDTAAGNMSLVDSDKTVTDKGHIVAVNADGSENLSKPLEMIKSRGNSSFEAEKKSYRIKLAEKASLLGLSGDKSFILQANAYDVTNLRNMLAYTLADRLGIKYVTNYVMTDVYLNGCYRGNYMLMEPVKVGKGHVDIEGPSNAYLLETVHREDRIDPGAQYFMCGSRIFLEFCYPEKVSDEQLEYVDNHLNRLQKEIEELKPDDSLEGLNGYIDMSSAAKMYLMDFLTNDIDSGSYSSFLYIDGNDSLVHLGPVWDYDKAWGNEIKRNELPEFNAYEMSWPMMLAENRQFQEIIKNELEAAEGGIRKLYDEDIYNFADLLEAALYMDNIRNELPNLQCVNTGTRAGDIKQLRDYMLKRYELLKEICADDDYCRVYINNDNTQFFWLKTGSSLGEERMAFMIRLYRVKHFYAENGEEISADTVFTKDTIIYGK